MATSINAYEKLYSNMKARFTVVNGDSDCSLGEYMLMKAGKKKESANIPVPTNTLRQPSALTSIITYVNDKLMVKEAPEKDKVMRAFPFRTTAAAVLSALLLCTFGVSYGMASLNALNKDTGTSYLSITEDVDTEEVNAKVEYSVN